MRLESLSLLIAISLVTIGLHAGPAGNSGKSGRPRLTLEQRLGQALFSDRNLSFNRNQSCATCHSLDPARDPLTHRKLSSPGFVDPDNVTNDTAVSAGSVDGRFGRLNSPSAGYAAFSPFFHWNGDEGLYVGGQFWNGRADTLAEQAAEPLLNPDEMAMPSAWAVVSRLKEKRQYVKQFRKVYDLDLDAVPAYESAPRALTPPPGVAEIYARMTQAIAAFEKSPVFNRFTSKFDFYLAGQTQLTGQEMLGLKVFEDEAKGNCAACHLSATTIAPDGNLFPPLFTDFTYDNVGVPRNVNIPGNPEPDPGLGGRSDVAARNPTGELGKHKVMSLRNIALTAPYGHNGVFKTLEQIVHFYNTRDVLGGVADNNDPGFGSTGWPAPEIAENVNTDELGDLGLTAEEEAALVAFMKTLTDGYPDWGRDPGVPPGTPSPFAATPFPPLP
jgi:cytochrome c peroxidase